jgi:hypothetical protein
MRENYLFVYLKALSTLELNNKKGELKMTFAFKERITHVKPSTSPVGLTLKATSMRIYPTFLRTTIELIIFIISTPMLSFRIMYPVKFDKKGRFWKFNFPTLVRNLNFGDLIK